jgi:hypothetical protein
MRKSGNEADQQGCKVMRLLFPVAWDFDCYGDVSPMTQISGSENTRKLVFGRYDSIECGGELLCGLLRT